MKKSKFVITTEITKGGLALRKARFKNKKDWESRQARKKQEKKSRKQNRKSPNP